ncbi:TonB family protein [Hymenobacter tibetensis]|uniref:TonB family protein n=1 Tax=Hymenobacter tibetensis TaxID=497967 RepID=A0ABY4CRW0_9BACT|nr:energy transducer TonB [Hymenobacter tibetensis]UOG72787.1 TonB family protein [Hymenobacter tibetensis]
MQLPDSAYAQAESGAVVPATVVDYYDANDAKLSSAENACYKVETVYLDSLNGTETLFYPSGKPRQSVLYMDVKKQVRHGEVVSWYENGKVHAREKYVNGKRQGELLVYYANGKLKRRDFYAHDTFTKGQCFGLDGKLVKHTPYECMPVYKGGIEGLLRDLSINLVYPDDALRSEIQGQVIISFVVGRDGYVKNVSVAKSLTPSTDAEAIRVVQNLKKLTPATQDGEAVSVSFRVPIDFAIQ